MVKLTDLEKRINLAKVRSAGRKSSRTDGAGFHLVVDLIGGLAVGVILGYSIDSVLHTKPLFLFILVILGICGGFYNFYKFDMKSRDKK